MVAWSNGAVVRLGSDASPAPPEPIVSGVSSIHSAVECVDAYGTVVEKLSLRVTSFNVIVQSPESVTASATDACMRSPGETPMLPIVTAGAGTSSHHAE